jgi:hypothetical protein
VCPWLAFPEFIHDYGHLIIVIGAAADWLRQYQGGDFDDDNDQPAPGKKEKMKLGDNTKKKKEFDGILDTMGVPDDDDVRRDIHEQIKNFPADGKRGTRELLIDIVKEWLENNNKKCQ